MCQKVDELNITNVSQLENEFYIKFEIDGFAYGMFSEQAADGLVHPRYIDHLDKNENCKYCRTTTDICLGLKRYLNIENYKRELLHRLIQFPSIRLKWLYIEHV